jgi:hypothetical protein
MRRWPETCTAIGVAWKDALRILAPFGLTDLFALRLRPTAADTQTIELVRQRAREKGWLLRWPRPVLELG